MEKENCQKSETSLEIKQDILKFANKLDLSDNTFLRDFSLYLKNRFATNSHVYEPDCDEKIVRLFDFIQYLFALPYIPALLDPKGCALLGKTPFDKLEFTKSLLECNGYSEYAKEGITEGCFVIVDCQGKAVKVETLLKHTMKYKDVSFVIFNNCENILKNEDTLHLFKHLSENHGEQLTYLAGDFVAEFVPRSLYILLGEENKLQEILKKGNDGDELQYRVSSFHHFIKICDFDEVPSSEERLE